MLLDRHQEFRDPNEGTPNPHHRRLARLEMQVARVTLYQLGEQLIDLLAHALSFLRLYNIVVTQCKALGDQPNKSATKHLLKFRCDARILHSYLLGDDSRLHVAVKALVHGLHSPESALVHVLVKI